MIINLKVIEHLRINTAHRFYTIRYYTVHEISYTLLQIPFQITI